ncbi:uncharacterized protein LOC143240067 [Tachypleus tridentatus]|uniref:uncharacterized protein LOC143240067 n=1 Tax=Tachypleus tridentatus TaxID=6853 RepID=UPI003FD0A00C
MRLFLSLCELLAVIILLTTGQQCDARRRDHSPSIRKSKELLKDKQKDFQLHHKHEMDINTIYSTDNKKQLQECHKFALYKCGKIFLKVSKLTRYLSGEQSYHANCALRQAFFTCIQKLRLKPCSHRKYNKDYNIDTFRKKLADSLWANRSCVLFTKESNK